MTIPTDPSSSYRAIENLIASYAELVDHGDFAGVDVLLADATFSGAAGSVTGRGAIEKMLRDNVIVYDDGTPPTKHVTTNIAIEVDEEAARQSRARTSPRYKPSPTWLYSPSSVAATKTASSVGTGSGASWRGASEQTSSVT
jgi:hypothetical protein